MKKRIIKSTITALLLVFLLSATAIFVGATGQTPELNIAQCSLSLRDSVSIKYAITSNVEDVKLLVWTSPQEEYVLGTQDYVITEYTTETISGVEHKVFTYSKLAAKQMADVVYTRAYAESGNEEYYSDLNKYSILQYAYNKLGKTGQATASQELRDLLVSMLDYGAAAQSYLDYNTDRPANADWYQIKVTGALLDDGASYGLYLPGDAVVLIAPDYEEESGIIFSHWENSKGESVSTERIYELTVGESNEHYTAVTKEVSDTPSTENDTFKPTQSPIVSPAYGTWYLTDIPSYDNGCRSEKTYIAGGGLDPTLPLSEENLMQIVSETTYQEFQGYLRNLEKAGYTSEFVRKADSNVFASYVKDGIRVYAYFMSRTGEARIIREYTSSSASVTDFAYTYEKSANESTVLYQYAIPMHDEDHAKDSVFKNNGMLYVIKLADNSVVIIDGANSYQMSTTQQKNFMAMLREITSTPDTQKIRIAGWYITHSHSDHISGFKKFATSYIDQLDFERIFFAFPSLNASEELFTASTGADAHRALIQFLNSETFADDDFRFMRLHTGQQFNLADVTFEVLSTHEDTVHSKTGITLLTSDYNDTSSVLRITIDGETFLILGDAANQVQTTLLKNWSASHLKSDGIQLSHHSMNDLSNLYNIVQADTVLVPQSLFAILENTTWTTYYEAAVKYAREDMVFFANAYTVGIGVVDGEWAKVYTRSRPLEDSELS